MGISDSNQFPPPYVVDLVLQNYYHQNNPPGFLFTDTHVLFTDLSCSYVYVAMIKS